MEGAAQRPVLHPVQVKLFLINDRIAYLLPRFLNFMDYRFNLEVQRCCAKRISPVPWILFYAYPFFCVYLHRKRFLLIETEVGYYQIVP